jgi:nicotinate phosphoribosyltransferase
MFPIKEMETTFQLNQSKKETHTSEPTVQESINQIGEKMEKNQTKQYTDKYFLRSNKILKADGLNPWVNMQVFVRKGPGTIAGVNEAVELITDNSNIEAVGGRIYAKKDGQSYESKETVMNIIAPIQEIMELETVYLGAIARGTTLANGEDSVKYTRITNAVTQVANLAGARPALYMGARHWHYDEDAAISKAAFDGGAQGASTDNGAATVGKEGFGTIPHALENIYAWKHGKENAVVETTKAFDRHIDPAVPRVALVDYNNMEITDALATAEALNGNLWGVRVDTCGENIPEGGIAGNTKYRDGTGVNVMGVKALREALDKNGYENVKVLVSSGFSDPAKVQAFNDAEEEFGMRLYDGIGAGFLDGVRTSTADVIAIGNTADEVDFYQGNVAEANIIHKIGRPPVLNFGLERLV